MMKATIYPMRNFYQRPMFWGVERDLKEVLETIEHTWAGVTPAEFSPFKETEQAYFLSVDVPGLNKANLDIQLEADALVVRGKRKLSIPGSQEVEQSIEKSFTLPEHVDTEKIQAHCEDGVLLIALPKLEKAKPKKIEIGDATTSKSSWKNLLGETFFKKKDSEPTVVN